MKELKNIIERIEPIQIKNNTSISQLAVIVSNEIIRASYESNIGLAPLKNELHILIKDEWYSIQVFLLRKFLMDCSIKAGMKQNKALEVSYINKIQKQIIVSSSIYRSQYK